MNRAARRLPPLLEQPTVKVAGHLQEAGAQVSALPPNSLFTSTLMTIALWTAAFGVMHCAMLAIGISPPLGMLMLAGSVTIVASFIPVGVIGTFEIT